MGRFAFPTRQVLIGTFTLATSFCVALLALEWAWPRIDAPRLPKMGQLASLPPVARNSLVITPVAISLAAIRDALERAAPRDLSGQNDNPLSQLLSRAEIGWSAARGPLALSGRGDALTVATPINGAMRVTGQVGEQASSLTGAIAGLVNTDIGRGLQKATGKALDQRADLRGNVVLTSRPSLQSNWRVDPNLTAQVAVADGALMMAGVKLNVGKEFKPILDRAVGEQAGLLQARLRNDPFIEQAARGEWAKMCRSIPLRAAAAGMPELWLELRPVKAMAAQPRIDANNLTLTVGVQAETRIVPNATKPNCPFPEKLELVSSLDQGRVAVAVPIDLPFIEIDKILEAQLKDRTYPDDGSGPVDVTVLGAKLSASGDRLLISLQVNAREKKSFFGFGAEATIHIWGKPVLDRAEQLLRLTDITLAVESDAAFGLLGAAARKAVPYLEKALAERAVIDLKPFAASARKSIEAALTDFRRSERDMRVDVSISNLRLADIAFDSKTLRVITEAEGAARVFVSALPH